MVYSKERGQMIDRIFKAFQHYIQEQNYFDIVYSEKIGYVWLLVDQPSDAVADVLDLNLAERHIRGGKATKARWEVIKSKR